MSVRSFCGAALALAGLLVGTGCGGAGKPVKTEGIITLDGKPVEGATVTFVPEAGGGPSASGITGSDGVFRLTTRNHNDGALPGDYKVTVEKKTADPTLNQDVSGAAEPADAIKQQYGTYMKTAAKKSPSPKTQLPAVYADGNKTPLKYGVPHSGRIQIELRSKGG